MENIKKKYELLKINTTEFQIKVPVVKDFPEIKVYVKNNGTYYGIFDGGTTVSSLFLTKNLFAKEFEKKLFDICKKRKVSKQGNVFFLETYEKDFSDRLNDFIAAINEICLI